jgi:ABC-2 type transport system permease protein
METIAIAARRELQLLRTNAHVLAIAVIAPLIFAVVAGSVYSARKLTALPITIIDQDRSALSREIISALLAAEPFIPGPYAQSPVDFAALAAKGSSHACFVFPPDFERNVKSGKAAAVLALVDTSNLITGNLAATTAASVLASYSVGIDIKKMHLRGVPEARARDYAMPVSLQTRVLFNPALNANYANFLVMGFLGIAVQLSGLLAVSQAASSVARMQLNSQATRIAAALHLAVVTAIVWLCAWGTVRFSIGCFEFPMRGRQWILGFVIFWFTANLAALGFGISCLAKDAVFASQICAIITMPNFLISGFTWPVFAMPGAMKILAYALPMKPFVFALRKIALMGAGPGDLGDEFGLLAAWSIAAFGFAAYGIAKLTRRIPAKVAS